MGYTVYLVAYAPSSPHRLQDLAKLAFSMNLVTAFIVIKPTGIAAQTGVPEISRLAYKLDKRFLVLPKLQDLKDIINIDQIFFVTHIDEALDLCDIIFDRDKSMSIVIQAGETPLSKEDLALGRAIKLSELNSFRSPNPVADAAIALMKLSKLLAKGVC